MTLKTHTIEKKNPKHKQVWEWEETPEVVAALKKLHAVERLHQDMRKVTEEDTLTNLNLGDK